ncbi:MAG: hypothetical protein O3C15_04585, partial [Proteobacteria bacterium]|nr:hypothetical protein [Pseudomonadota bacterium]
NEVFSRQFRIFLDIGIAGLPTIDEKVELATTLGALEAELQLNAMIEGIEILKEDARFRSLQVEGVSPGDLGHKVADFQRLYFNPIYAGAFQSDPSSGLGAIYRRDLMLEISEIEASLAELNDRITAITELQRTNSSSNPGRSEINGGSSQVQIEGDALNQLVTLSRTASLAEYLERSFDKRAELIERKASINTRLQKMGGDSDGDGDRLLSSDFIATAAEKFAGIKQVYSALLVKAQATSRAEVPSLYQVSSQVQGGKLLQRRDFLFIALALALGGMVAIIAALMWPNRTP